MITEGSTIKDLKEYFSERLTSKFSKTELNLMVKLLVVNRLMLSEEDYILGSNVSFSSDDIIYFEGVLKRIESDEPFQHILGEVEFYGLKLIIDHRALIPRPETEELVDWIRSEMQGIEKPTFTDLCSGSGCIAFALKSVFEDSPVLAVEYSNDALMLIGENEKYTGIDLEVFMMDVLNPLAYLGFDREMTDCVVSNPPYIPNKDKQLMAKNVLEYEPHMALFVEDGDPLIFYRTIAENINYVLKPEGKLFFEIHEDLAQGVIQILEDNGFVNIELRKDLQGKDRMVKAQKRKFTP
ncbi:MAG: peptide chain release factor N(5)-glutamine methyltransferase [Crocinitomicaceae bacterium]|nr:peptide chain release factor N(5)-glutamine methyltransferase [Crocinitomicaceae bacterium]